MLEIRKAVLGGIVVIAVLLWLLPQEPVSLAGALLIVLFGFFFGAVASRKNKGKDISSEVSFSEESV